MKRLQEKLRRESSQFWSKAKIKAHIHRTREASLGLGHTISRSHRHGTRKPSMLRHMNRIRGMTPTRGLKLMAKIHRRKLEGAMRYYHSRGNSVRMLEAASELVIHCRQYFKRTLRYEAIIPTSGS